MKIPASLRINGIDFMVIETPGLNDKESVLYGFVDHGMAEIRINSNNQTHQRKCATLWHEAFHAVCEMNCIDLGDQKEKIIDTFAFAVNQILQDNGKNLFDIRSEV